MFVEHMNTMNTVEPFHQVPATTGKSYVPGEALAINSAGTVTKCTGTTEPQYICQKKLDSAVAGDTIAVTLVHGQQKLEVPLEVEGTSLKVGNKVTIGTDGLTVTATTTGGIFLITDILGTAVGDKVRGYFKR